MLTAKVYEVVKTDVAYIQDKIVTNIMAKSRINEYLQQREFIDSATVQLLCGNNKDQAYRILHSIYASGDLEKTGTGRSTKYRLKS